MTELLKDDAVAALRRATDILALSVLPGSIGAQDVRILRALADALEQGHIGEYWTIPAPRLP